MAGVSGRRDPSQRLASGVGRRSPVGAAPGAFRVRRDGGGDKAEQAAPGGALSDLGFFRVDASTYIGTTLLSGTNDVAPDSQNNSLVDSGAATYNSGNGLFQIVRAGLWVIQADVRTNTAPAGYLHLRMGREGFAEAGPNQSFIADSTGPIARGMSAPGVGYVGSFWSAGIYLASSGPVITSAYVVLYPIAYFD